MKPLLRWLSLVAVALVALQLFFVARIATMAVVAPQSSSFQRSEAWRLATEKDGLHWRQQWVPYSQISDNLKRAVIASEDDGFSNHDGVDWDALEKAWEKNAKAEERAAKQKPVPKAAAGKPAAKPAVAAKPAATPKAPPPQTPEKPAKATTVKPVTKKKLK